MVRKYQVTVLSLGFDYGATVQLRNYCLVATVLEAHKTTGSVKSEEVIISVAIAGSVERD